MKLFLILFLTIVVQGQALFTDAQKAELLQHYRALVQIDTTAGNETKAVEYLKKVIEAEGIATKTFSVDPARANLVARLKGNGSKRPLLLMAHTDVVRVQREKWPVDPFGAVMKDGYIWGRGSVDDKPILASELMVFLTLKRSGAMLDRDVIFFAESGEEGESEFGAEFMAREHFDEIEAEYCLTEGGSGTLRVDVPLPPKPNAPAPAPPPKPVVAEAPKPAPATPPKPLSRLEKLRLESMERAKAASK